MEMEKKEKRVYVSPECIVVNVEPSNLICTSVEPGPGVGLTEQDFDSSESHDGGDSWVGGGFAP